MTGSPRSRHREITARGAEGPATPPRSFNPLAPDRAIPARPPFPARPRHHAAARADRDDDGARVLSLDLPVGLIEVIRRVLGSFDRYAGELGMRDPDWRGRVLVTPPPAAAVPFGVHLLQLYESGAVSGAILVVQRPQDSAWWRPLAGRPHCLLSSAALEGRPAAPPTVFLLSGSADVRGRFIDAFRRLGYLYPDGAVSEIAPARLGSHCSTVPAPPTARTPHNTTASPSTERAIPVGGFGLGIMRRAQRAGA